MVASDRIKYVFEDEYIAETRDSVVPREGEGVTVDEEDFVVKDVWYRPGEVAGKRTIVRVYLEERLLL